MINEVFDKIYWINSRNRMDRMKNMKKRLTELGIKADRFEAVLGGHINRTKYKFGQRPLQVKELNNGELGCYLSHVNIWKDAKEKGYKRILILEDDALFCNDFHKAFNEHWANTPDNWELLYLGQWNYDNQINGGNAGGGGVFALKKIVWESGKDTQRAKGGVYLANRCWLTHAYAVDEKVYDKLIEGAEVMYSSVDNVLADLQKDIITYAYYPNIITQDNTKSSLR